MWGGWLLGLWMLGQPVYGAPAACTVAAEVLALARCSQEQAPPGANPALRWLRIDLQAAAPEVRVLALGVPDALWVELWQSQGTAPAQHLFQIGEGARHVERPLPGPRLNLPVTLREGHQTLWLGYRIHANGRLAPRLLSTAAERSSQGRRDLFNGLFFGVMLTLAGVVATARWVGGSSAYLAYVLLVLAELFALTQTEGYAFAWFWPEAPRWNQMAPGLCALLTLAAHALFAMRFLALRERMPRLWLAHAGVLALAGLLLLVLAQPWGLAATLVLNSAYALLSIGTALRAWQLGLAGAPLYGLGVLSLALWAGFFFSLGVVGLNPFPGWNFLDYPKIGGLLEAAFFSAAFINRVRERQRLQAEQRLRRLAETEEMLALEHQRQAAVALAQQQGLRLAGASHDISQPLASLRYAIEALKRSDSPAAITQHLDHTLSYAQTLLSDLIQQTRAELPAGPDRIALGPWLQAEVAQHRAAAHARGLHLRVAACSAEVEGSQLILARILHNLLGNALRYTQRGSVLVGVRRRAEALELQVWDSGPGLAPEQVERLLQPFERGASGEHGHGHGHGLGLFIVKSLCQQCGYSLRVHSRLGRGSGFCIRVPTTVDTVSD